MAKTTKAPGRKDAKGGDGIIATIMSYLFGRKDPRKPVKGLTPRLKNIAFKHYRGLIGVIVPLCVLSWQGEKGQNNITVQCMWMWMFWFFLFQPVNIPVTAMIPLFLLPMTGAMSTPDTCQCYMNENIALFILTNMLTLLLNNSGMDRRIALWFMCLGNARKFSAPRLIIKCSLAAFFLGMLSNRLIATKTLMQYMTPVFTSLHSASYKSRGTEPNYDEMRNIVNNAIQTAASIGSTAILHSAYATLTFRAIWCESAPDGFEYPDIFNYLNYSLFAFPTALVMLILNFCYHMILIKVVLRKSMSVGSMTEARKTLLNYKSSIPSKVTLHEKLTVFFTLFSLLMFLSRWSPFLNMGWGDFRKEETSPQIPGVKDATTAALFVIFLHILPKGFGFVKYLHVHKKSQLPPIKPESAILWWRFVDKNMNYGYIFLLGSGVALQKAIRKSGLDRILTDNLGKQFTGIPWEGSLFVVCFLAIALANAMTGVAACVVFLPFVINMSLAEPPAAAGFLFRSNEWPTKLYIGALGVGVASSLGFMFPFMFTPAYFCHHTGKVPMRRMAKYSLGSVIICLVILWISLLFYAPLLWDPAGNGIVPVPAPSSPGANTTVTTTTAAP